MNFRSKQDNTNIVDAIKYDGTNAEEIFNHISKYAKITSKEIKSNGNIVIWLWGRCMSEIAIGEYIYVVLGEFLNHDDEHYFLDLFEED